VPHVPNDVLEEMFLHGMKRSLREQVVRLRPLGMDEIVEMAQIIEAQENERSSYNSRSFHRTNSAPALNNSQRNSNFSMGRQSEVTPNRKSFESQRENKGSESKRPIQNPCRHCGERFFSGHKCKVFQKYKCLEVEEESERDEELDRGSEEEEEPQKQQELQVLSLKSMVGITTKKTLRIRGYIGDAEVVVLIDSGASCNFIATRLVHKLGLQVTPTQEFGVAIGDGRVLTSSGKCEEVKINIQGVGIREEYLVFDLGATDMVLGYTWLEKLGEMKINWGLHLLRFQIGEQWVTLAGDPDLLCAQVSFRTMEKLCEKEDG
ncbi:PREDICTED: uncharacterized protein LOC106321935, partial [Brassica oleracea var. oleracea]|uniref:uncharacterized protein LOC106321935 n=1 Tax=Brassica oleracea var. oleracea TaxID=109376 RepID=UPI0006A6BB04